MTALPPRRCPRCREEYLGSVERCPECDVALVAEGELPVERQVSLPPVSELERIRIESPGWIELLAERLTAEHIESRVELLDEPTAARGRVEGPCALYVRPEHAERAREVDRELLQEQIPDLPEDASGEWAEAEGCPACGAELAADASECPDCGLAFGD